jgi:dynein heavy chain
LFRFYEVYCEVEPKRLALEKANAELKAARDKLDVVNRQVAVCIFLEGIFFFK